MEAWQAAEDSENPASIKEQDTSGPRHAMARQLILWSPEQSAHQGQGFQDLVALSIEEYKDYPEVKGC